MRCGLAAFAAIDAFLDEHGAGAMIRGGHRDRRRRHGRGEPCGGDRRRAPRCVLIEAEAQPGYHATGRSAAFWTETYGGPRGPAADQRVRAVAGATAASSAPRGALHLARAGRAARRSTGSRPSSPAAACGSTGSIAPASPASLPGVRAGWDAALAEPSTAGYRRRRAPRALSAPARALRARG